MNKRPEKPKNLKPKNETENDGMQNFDPNFDHQKRLQTGKFTPRASAAQTQVPQGGEWTPTDLTLAASNSQSQSSSHSHFTIKQVARAMAAVVKAAIAVVAVVLVVYLSTFVDVAAVINHVEHASPLESSLVLVAVMAFGTPLFLPTTPLNLCAGAVLGVWVGSLVAMAGCVLGALLNFGIARYSPLNAWAKDKLDGDKQLRAVALAVSRKGLLVITLARLSPLFPYAILSFVFGVCPVSVSQYTLGTALGLLPGAVLYCWIGKSMSTLAHSDGGWGDPSIWLSIIGSLISIVWISKVAQSILKEAEEDATKDAQQQSSTKSE
eukprot:m.181126 g.181126  ORF g.181126 m.181126 type:complete len:323 (-) comp18032_c0_seq1:1625-2593(-)